MPTDPANSLENAIARAKGGSLSRSSNGIAELRRFLKEGQAVVRLADRLVRLHEVELEFIDDVLLLKALGGVDSCWIGRPKDES